VDSGGNVQTGSEKGWEFKGELAGARAGNYKENFRDESVGPSSGEKQGNLTARAGYRKRRKRWA